MSRKLQITPQPDFTRLETVLRRQGTPDRVPFFELYSNIEEEVLAALGVIVPNPGSEDYRLRKHIAYMYTLGYDYVNAGARNFGFPQAEQPTAMTAQGERSYLMASTHWIANRRDFDNYPWPNVADADGSPLEEVEKILPEGMKVIAGSAGVLENVMWLLGYEGISYLLADDEPLVRDMFDAVGSRITAFVDLQASYDAVGAMVMGGDMGFKTQTLVSPAVLRQYVFPWHRKIVEAAHRHGKPIILHSCGNLSEVMEDIIACGWDAKHSFEDQIEPVWEAKRRYGQRISVLGGLDMDKIARMSEEEVRRETRSLIEKCAPAGGWALGTGNTVANYIPAANFLAMLEEGWRVGRY